MTLEEVLALRPKDGSSDAIRAALDAAKTACETLRQQAHDLDAKRAASLLEADDAELIAAEEAASRNRLAADRIVALTKLMETDLKAALAREAADRVHAAVLEVNERAERFMAAWRKVYPRAAAAIVRLIEMDEAHVEALDRLHSIIGEAAADGGHARPDTPVILDPREVLFGTSHNVVGNAIQLPSVHGRLRASPFWEPKKLVTGYTAADDVAVARARPVEVGAANPAAPEPPPWMPGLQGSDRIAHADAPGFQRVRRLMPPDAASRQAS